MRNLLLLLISIGLCGVAEAKNLYVSTTGSDATSYAANDNEPDAFEIA